MTLHPKPTPPLAAEPLPQPDAYRLYYSSGFYDRRYPSPNRTMWRRIESLLSPVASVLDFGCGNGRYLLRLHGRVARAIGFDVSRAALETIRARAAAQDWRDLVVLGPEPEALDAHVWSEGQVDVALCLFGVLGHITDPGARADALLRIRRALKPGAGRLLISVPNHARRFAPEQAAAGGTLIRYHRETETGDTLSLDYQLFDPDMLVAELTAAGFVLCKIGCESVLPESWLLNHAALRWLDGLMTPWCPARWGYGIYAEAAC